MTYDEVWREIEDPDPYIVWYCPNYCHGGIRWFRAGDGAVRARCEECHEWSGRYPPGCAHEDDDDGPDDYPAFDAGQLFS